jgi:hypothetical protein
MKSSSNQQSNPVPPEDLVLPGHEFDHRAGKGIESGGSDHDLSISATNRESDWSQKYRPC